MKKIHRRSLLSLLAVAVLSSSSWAWAQDRAQAVRFDIAAQPVGPALNEFGKQTGLHVVVDSDLASGMKSPGVRGEFSPDAALSRLLADTGLRYRFVDEDTVAVLGPEVGLRLKGEASWSDALRMAQADAGSSASSQGVEEKQDGQGAAESSDGVKLEEVVVTAQKRVERLVDVPISVSVLKGADFEKSGARGVSDALNQVGGVNLIEIEPGRSQISIRGASAGGITLTGSSPVGYYLDELPFSWISNAFVPDANAFDLERVEVLRGPQGTLYGASSLNGVVRILSNDANLSEFQLRGRARTGWTGGDDSQSGDMVVNLPLVTDRLAVRAVASYADIGGYIDTATTPDFNDSEIQNYRLKFNAQPTDRLSVELGAYFSRIDNNGAPAAFDDYTIDTTPNQGIEREYDAYNLVVSYEFPGFTLLSSTGYIDLRGAGNFALRLPPNVDLVDNLSADAFTEEVRFNSNFDGPWQISGGVFYRTIEQVLEQAIPALYRFPLEFTDKSDSYAVFSEVTRSFWNGKLDLTGGIRYFEDTVDTTEQSTLRTGAAGPFIVPREASFDAVTWRAVVAYHPSEDRTLYASVATGFRSGFNQAATSLAVEPTLPDIQPDDLITYEIGFKGASSEGRLFFDTSAYYTEWNDTQQLRPTAIRTAAIINAESVSGFGVDASLSARPTDNLTLNGNLGWNSLEFDADTFLGANVLLPEGERMNVSPELTVGLGAEYTFPLGGNGLEGFFAGDARYTSRVTSHDVVAGIPVHRVFDNIYDTNLRAGIQSDNWTISAFAENVLDKNGALGPVTGQPLPAATRQRPRTIGLQATFEY